MQIHIEYFLTVFHKFADLTGFYDTGKRISLITNDDCRQYTHGILEMVHKKLEEICYWSHKSSKYNYTNLGILWLNFDQELEKSEKLFTNTIQFKAVNEKDKQLILVMLTALKEDCTHVPKDYTEIYDYAEKNLRKIFKLRTMSLLLEVQNYCGNGSILKLEW